MAIIDGKKISQDIKDEIRTEVLKLNAGGVYPKLAVVLVGDDPASAIYVRDKKRACEVTGIQSESYELPQDVSQNELLTLIERLNNDSTVSGILVQFPLPKHIDSDKVLFTIDPRKDVDCFHPLNTGRLWIGKPSFLPCTPAGVIELLKRSCVTISGKNCVIIGRSNIVGKPMAALLLSENGTVTLCHSKTKDLTNITKKADILIAAMRMPKFITSDMIKENVIIIDVGIHRIEGTNKLCGDVDFAACADKCSLITPVPGGVGPMTIAMLMRNCLTAAKGINA